jgi:hypothetical protein
LGGNLTLETPTKPPTKMETTSLCNANGSQPITVRDLPDEIAEMIQQQIARLKQQYNYVLNCQVSAAVPALYQSGIYQIQLVLNLPDRDVTIDREPTPDYYQEDIYVAIWSTFDLARKKLQGLNIPIEYTLSPTPTPQNSYPSIRTLRRCRGYAGG